MSHTAQGSLSLAMAGVETLLADSVTFRASVRAADADQAKRHVHFVELLELDAALGSLPRPCAIVIPETHGYEQFGVDSHNQLGARGGIVAVLAKNALKSADRKAVVLDFTNWLGGILDECGDLAGADGYFPFRALEVIEGPLRADLDERATDDYWLAVVLFSHNVNP